jgi:hypothetical protein
MSSVDEHKSSRPPPPPSTRIATHPDQVADDARRGRERSREALATAREALEVGQEIRALIGESPDPARGLPGTPGLLLGICTLHKRLDDMEQRLEERDKIARELATAEAARIEQRGMVARWIFAALSAIGAAFGIWKATR